MRLEWCTFESEDAILLLDLVFALPTPHTPDAVLFRIQRLDLSQDDAVLLRHQPRDTE